MRLAGIWVSGPTIQSILAKHGAGSPYERLLKLEERAAKEKFKLTAAQAVAIKRANPCFRERHVESRRPGECSPRTPAFTVEKFIKSQGKKPNRTPYLNLLVPFQMAKSSSHRSNTFCPGRPLLFIF